MPTPLDVTPQSLAAPLGRAGAPCLHDPRRAEDVSRDTLGPDEPALALPGPGADTARFDRHPEAAGLAALLALPGEARPQLEAGHARYGLLPAWTLGASAETHNWPAEPA